MSRKSILCGYTCQKNFVVVMLPLVLTVFCMIQSNNVVQSQAIMNQLAALFRSRPAWPTNFPSGTTTNANGESNQNETPSLSDALNSKNPGLEDFTHFNDLLTGQSIGQSINQLHLNENGGSDDNGMGLQQQLYPGAPILATSHPIPQLEMPNPSGNGKSILLAHPVLGPNPMEPFESPEHKFNGMMVNPLNLLNDNAGLYSATQRPSAVRFPKNFNLNNNNKNNDRLKNGFQNFAHKLFFPNSKHQNSNNHKGNFQKMIQVSGKPPPGGKIVAIPVPVPSTSSLWKNHQNFMGGRHQSSPQIIAIRQPFPPFTAAPTQSPQGVTSFLAKFSPSPMDMSSYAPIIEISTATTDSTLAPSLIATNATTKTAFSTPMPATTTSTPVPYDQGHRYTDQISSGSEDNERFSSTVVTAPPPTTTTTYRPSNNIQDMIQNSGAQSIQGSPSSVVSSFRYPDPPTPPRMQNMNTRYELQNQDALTTKSEWVPKKQQLPTPTTPKSNYNSAHPENGNNNTNGIFSPISSIPHISSSNAKWKYEDSSNSASVLSSTSALVTGPRTNFKGRSDSDQIRNHKSAPNTDPSFKPSLQLHSFEDSTSGLREFITLNPHSSSNKKKSRDGKSLMFQSAAESSLIPYDIRESSKDSPVAMEMMESGFRPFNHFAFVNGISSASVSSTTESSMMNRLRDEFTKDIVTANVWSNMDPTPKTTLSKGKTRQNRQFFSASPVNGYTNTKPFYAPAPGSQTITVGASYSNGGGYNYNSNSQQNNAALKSSDWVGRFGQYPYQFPFTPTTTKKSQPKKYATSTASSSSELYEDWLLPTTKRKKENKDHHKHASESKSNSNTSSFSISASSTSRKLKRPSECEKFDKFGFCPVSSQYPLDKVESIGVRCKTLLSHLIAPLPTTDVRYDVIISKSNSNSSHKGKSSGGQSGWNWKTFPGKPVCDTREAKILPGWAKNELGEWLIVLQTKEMKQEAQISLCTQNSHPDDKEEAHPKMKCVQRFTSQRLVVLDPENELRCPVVRSVFLPSACVCLNDGEKDKKEKKSKHSSRHHHHHKHDKNTTTPSTGSDDKKEASPSSKFISGRSLLTTLFGLDLDPASGENHEVIHTVTTEDSKSDAKSSEEATNPRDPSSSPFTIIEEERETSNESGESGHRPSKRSISISSSLGSSFLRASGSSNVGDNSGNINPAPSLNLKKNDNFSNG